MTEYAEFRDERMSEVTDIYRENGWVSYFIDPDRLKRAFRNSLCIIGAFRGGNLLGFARCVGDGETIVYIQDLIVRPDFHRQGIGRELLCHVSERFPDVRQFLLITDADDPVSNAFYRAVGMVKNCSGFPVCAYFRP